MRERSWVRELVSPLPQMVARLWDLQRKMEAETRVPAQRPRRRDFGLHLPAILARDAASDARARDRSCCVHLILFPCRSISVGIPRIQNCPAV